MRFTKPFPNPAEPEPKIFVHYSPVIPAKAGIRAPARAIH